MKKTFSAILLVFFTCFLNAQTIINRDPEIKKMVDEISRDKIQQYVKKLVSFKTRHDLSTQNDSNAGIGAAWNWIKSEMEKNIPESDGRLEVKFEEYSVGGPGDRIPHVTRLKNVVATLKGTDPTDDRRIVISAHLDSRAEVDNDSTSLAPGANDDGSGVAAILELLRIMSARKFSATIVFMTVSGEEQGLYGSKFMAEKAKKENWNIIAMINNDMIGNSGSSETLLNDNTRVRVFSEGVPSLETEQMIVLRKYTSGENDSKSRQLARYIKETGERYVDQIDVTLIFRNDRFGRSGDQTPFCQEGFTAVRMTEYNENYDRTHKVPAVENGIPLKILGEAFIKAKTARLQIIDVIEKEIAKPREKIAPSAPEIIVMKIKPDQIGLVIGSGGKTINEIRDVTHVEDITIEDDGSIFITGKAGSAEKAKEIIYNMTREYMPGEKFEGEVVRLMDFGAFVKIGPNAEGLVHVSEIAPFRVERVETYIQEGMKVPVAVKEVDDKGRLNLSIKAANPTFFTKKDELPAPPRPPRSDFKKRY